jgi:hypothetical protein
VGDDQNAYTSAGEQDTLKCAHPSAVENETPSACGGWTQHADRGQRWVLVFAVRANSFRSCSARSDNNPGKARPSHPRPIATDVKWMLFAHSPSFLVRVWRFNFTPVVVIGAGATVMRMRCGASREGLFVGVRQEEPSSR